MTRLPKNHPFVLSARKLEILEANEGVSPEVVKGRFLLKKRFPEYFDEYMVAKRKKENLKLAKEKVIKEIETRKFGSETVSYYKNKIKEQKKKNYLKKQKLS